MDGDTGTLQYCVLQQVAKNAQDPLTEHGGTWVFRCLECFDGGVSLDSEDWLLGGGEVGPALELGQGLETEVCVRG